MAETLSSDASDFRPPPHAVPRRTRGEMWRPGLNHDGGSRYGGHMDNAGGGRQRYGTQQGPQGSNEAPEGRQREHGATSTSQNRHLGWSGNDHEGYRNRGRGRGGIDYAQRGGRGDYRPQAAWDQQSQHSHRGTARRVTRGPPSNPSLNRLSSTDSDATGREQMHTAGRQYGPTGGQGPRTMSVYEQDRVYQPKQAYNTSGGKSGKMTTGQQSPAKDNAETPRETLGRSGNGRAILAGPPSSAQMAKATYPAKPAPVEAIRPPPPEPPGSPSNKPRPSISQYSAQQPPYNTARPTMVPMETGRVMTSPSALRPIEQTGPPSAALIPPEAHWGPQIAGRVVPVGPHFLSPITGMMAPPSPLPLTATIETPPQFDPKYRGPNPLTAGPPLKLHNMRLSDYVAALTRARTEKRRALQEREPPISPPVGESAEVAPQGPIKYSIEFMLKLKDSPASRDSALHLPSLNNNSTSNSGNNKDFGSRGGHHARRRSLTGQQGPSPGELHPTRTNEFPHRYDDTPQDPTPILAPPSEPSVPIPPPRVPKPQLSKEAALQRHVKSLLNKMTVERFVEISNMLSGCLEKIENLEQLKIVVDEVYKKSVSEPNFSEMYADLVLVLRARSPQFPNPEPNAKPWDFQRGILMRCQDEFNDMGDFSKLNLPPEMLEQMNEDDIEIERKTRKTRTLGNMRFIGELFVRRVVGGGVAKTILVQLLDEDKEPEAHLVECICELLSTIGPALEAGFMETLDTLCDTLVRLRASGRYENRICYKIQDLLELRDASWRQKTVFKQKAKALSEFRHDAEGPEVEIVGQESNHPYKDHVRYWNDQFSARKKEAKARRNEEPPTAPLMVPPSAEPLRLSSPSGGDQEIGAGGSISGDMISPLSAVSNGGETELSPVVCE